MKWSATFPCLLKGYHSHNVSLERELFTLSVAMGQDDVKNVSGYVTLISVLIDKSLGEKQQLIYKQKGFSVWAYH